MISPGGSVHSYRRGGAPVGTGVLRQQDFLRLPLREEKMQKASRGFF